MSGYPTVDCPSRKLRAAALSKFGIKTSLSESDGKTPTHMYFPMKRGTNLVGYYVKTLSKPSHTWSIGDVKKADLFGLERALDSGAYRLIITEGKEDAVAIEAIYDRYGKEEYRPAVVSLPNGTQSAERALSDVKDVLSRTFREIVLCYDNDKPGQDAVRKSMLILPKAKSVVLPRKDPNQCIIDGVTKAAFKALSFDTFTPKNTRLINANTLFSSAREPTPYGQLTWPYPSMNDMLRGIRYGETIYAGAGVKMGKSELVDDLASHFIINHNVKVFMAKPEQQNKKTLKKVAGKVVGHQFDDPKVEFDYDLFDKACEKIGDKLLLVDLYQHMGWDTLKEDIISAAHEGAKVIFIDPITNLTAGMNSGDANTKLQEITRDLSSLALDLELVVFIFCHLKSPEGNLAKDARLKKYSQGQYHKLGNCPHERGGDVLSNQFAGSRAMMQACNLMIGLEGNRDEELPEEVRNTRWLTILEDREFGNSSSVRLFWNKGTTKFKEY